MEWTLSSAIKDIRPKLSNRKYTQLQKTGCSFDRLKHCNPDTRFFPRHRQQHPSPPMKDNRQVGANIEIINQPDAHIAKPTSSKVIPSKRMATS